LKLVASLAEQAPQAFLHVALPSLLQLVASCCGNQACSASLMQIVVQTAVAMTHTNTNTTEALVVGTVLSTTATVTVDANSPAAQLGESCLALLLPRVHEECLESLMMAADQVPALFCRVLDSTVQTCLKLAATSSDETTQLQAIQVLASLCAHGTLRRQYLSSTASHAILESSLPQCLQIMISAVDPDSGDEWAMEAPTLADDSYDSWDDTATYARDLMESLAHSFSNVHIVTRLEPLLVANEWRMPHAALAALASCAQAAPRGFAPHANGAVQAALLCATHEHVRVQYQAMVLLGTLCESVPDEHGRVLQALAQGLTSACYKISAVASCAVVSYCRAANNNNSIGLYLSHLLKALVSGPLSLELTNIGSVVVKVRAIGAVACLAEATGEAFAPFYGSVVPGLLQYASLHASNHYMSNLKGAALEAATLIGQAIGEDNRQLFVADAESIMTMAVSVLNQSTSGDIVAGLPLDQLLASCARIASIMKEQYAPYLSVVLPHLLRRATDTSGDVEISEGVESDASAPPEIKEEAGTESMTVAIPGRGLTKVTINTSKIQEKAQALRAIYEHAVALKSEFGPFAQTCLDSFLPFVQYKYSTELRATAAQTLAAVFESAVAAGEEIGMGIPSNYFPLLAQTVSIQIVSEDEDAMEVMYSLADSLSEIFDSVYSRFDDHGEEFMSRFLLNDAFDVVQLCMRAMVACLERRSKIINILQGSEGSLSGEDERDEYEALLKLEEGLLVPLVDTVGYTLKLKRQEFVPIFEAELVPVLGLYLRSGNDVRARLSAVCLFDDCIEFCGTTAAAKYANQLIVGAIAGLDDTTNGGDMDLKRASMYGIAQIARHAPSDILKPHSQSIVPHLLGVTSQSKADAKFPVVHENAVSALASLTLFGTAPFRDVVSEDIAINEFLTNMPLTEDYDEAKICSAGLCDLIENGKIRLDANCNELVRIISETMVCVESEDDVASDETLVRFASILFTLKNEAPADVMNKAFAMISLEGQNAVNGLMDQYSHHFSAVVTP
jgi:hypothetical protein